jgi:HEAT repeat protein
MKLSIPFKLGIGVVLLFAVLIAAMFAYQPLRYRWLKSQLLSDNPKTREQAIKTLAADGKRAIPHLRRWLMSKNDKLVTTSCGVLEKIKGNFWKEALPELQKVLEGSHSDKTDAAASLITEKKYGYEYCMCGCSGPMWIRFRDNTAVQRNICIYLMNKDEDTDEDLSPKLGAVGLGAIGDRESVRHLCDAIKDLSDPEANGWAAEALGVIGDEETIELLKLALEKHVSWHIRDQAAWALGEFGNSSLCPVILKALSCDSDETVRESAAWALPKIAGSDSFEGIHRALMNSNEDEGIEQLTYALGKTGDARAVEVLKQLINNDEDGEINSYIAIALGFIDSPEAMDVLLDQYTRLPEYADSLARFENPRVQAVLRKSLKGHEEFGVDETAAYILAWQNGGADLETLEKKFGKDRGSVDELRRQLCRFRWGNHSALEPVLEGIWEDTYWPDIKLHYYYEDVLARLPEKCPKYCLRDGYANRRRKVDEMHEWLKENTNRLAWDADKQRYYLKPEAAGKEAAPEKDE